VSERAHAGKQLDTGPEIMFKRLYAERARLSDPERLAVLDSLLVHMQAELVTLDLDVTMSTLCDHPVYRFFGVGGAMPDVIGWDAVREMYRHQFEAGATRTAGMFPDQVLVGADGVMLAGELRMRGEHVSATFPELTRGVDQSRPFCLVKRCVSILLFRDGKMTGEEFFFDGPYGAEDIVYLD
jgi:hypothetical protein